MRIAFLAVVALPALLGGCLSYSETPARRETVVVPQPATTTIVPGTTVVPAPGSTVITPVR